MTVSPQIVALIVAAGRGVRAGGGVPKQYRPLLGHPLLSRTLDAFLTHPQVTGTLVVIHPDDRDLYQAAAEGRPLLPPVDGGAQRQDSVRAGLEALAAGPPDYVLIHDAARPFVEAALIARVIEALARNDGAVPGLALSDTIKHAADGQVLRTVPRDGLFRVQTPQGFRFEAILAAHRVARGQALTDDAAVAEAAGLSVAVVPGDEGNMKVTEPEDFAKAEARLRPDSDFVVGYGYDVHRFEPGDHVWLCGVKVPHSHALEGHSDADAGLHALTDALLGAIGAGDIGVHFPPSDPQWKDAPSAKFLAHAAKLVADAGGAIVNVDITVICERPKIGPHRPVMIRRLSEILDMPPARINIKATTTEGLGFTGRREGLAAQAVASVRVPR